MMTADPAPCFRPAVQTSALSTENGEVLAHLFAQVTVHGVTDSRAPDKPPEVS